MPKKGATKLDWVKKYGKHHYILHKYILFDLYSLPIHYKILKPN